MASGAVAPYTAEAGPLVPAASSTATTLGPAKMGLAGRKGAGYPPNSAASEVGPAMEAPPTGAGEATAVET